MLDVHFKDGVDPSGIQLPIIRAIAVTAGVLNAWGRRCTVTSINDGEHSTNSLHYEGMAFDLRTRDEGPSYKQWPLWEKRMIAQAIKNHLGGDYDVVVEGDHIHIEFDPK